jgi:hypothetical protein
MRGAGGGERAAWTVDRWARTVKGMRDRSSEARRYAWEVTLVKLPPHSRPSPGTLPEGEGS